MVLHTGANDSIVQFDAFPEPLLPYFVSEIFQGFDEPDLHDGVVFGLLPKLFNLISKADLVVDGNQILCHYTGHDTLY